MKNLSLFYLIVAFVLLLGCSEDSPISPRSTDSGNLSIKFDKTAVPDEVVSVIATLTRSNFTPVVGQLNLQSSTSAELLIEELAVGNWHLLVEALDQNNNVLYSGETEIEILANTITPVQLTLNPVSSGMGSIHITVTWGTFPPPSEWTDYENNPLLVKSGNFFDTFGVLLPHLIFEDNTYKMWYMGLGPSDGAAYVLYATSPDGLNWTPNNGPVISPGVTWDSTAACPGPVLKEDGIYKMYYCGFNSSYGTWSIGLAVSNDGINWEKNPNPVLYGLLNTWEQQITAHHIEKIDGQYYLYYTGRRNQTQHKIGLATSSDGINWTRHSDNPILVPEDDWEGVGVAYPSIIKEDNIYKMIYGSINNSPIGNAFGIAESNDGINWQKSNNNPIFTKANTLNNYAKIGYPFWYKADDSYLLYYAGTGNPLSWEICLATKPI